MARRHLPKALGGFFRTSQQKSVRHLPVTCSTSCTKTQDSRKASSSDHVSPRFVFLPLLGGVSRTVDPPTVRSASNCACAGFFNPAGDLTMRAEVRSAKQKFVFANGELTCDCLLLRVQLPGGHTNEESNVHMWQPMLAPQTRAVEPGPEFQAPASGPPFTSFWLRIQSSKIAGAPAPQPWAATKYTVLSNDSQEGCCARCQHRAHVIERAPAFREKLTRHEWYLCACTKSFKY